MTITIHTKNEYNYWAHDGSDSAACVYHLIGTRYFVEPQVDNLKLLARLHGWSVEIVKHPDD